MNDDQTASLHPVVAWSAGVVPVALIIVLGWAWTYDDPESPAPRTGAAFIRHFIYFGLFKGYTAGSPDAAQMARFPVELLEPGDVIICGNPHGVYGTWSHATIYLGDHQVLAQDLLTGIGVEYVEGLEWYDHFRVLRPQVSAATRAAAAATAKNYVGQVFNLMSHPRDPWQWNCSRCVEGAYRTQGVEIADGRFWVTPDALDAGDGALIVER